MSNLLLQSSWDKYLLRESSVRMREAMAGYDDGQHSDAAGSSTVTQLQQLKFVLNWSSAVDCMEFACSLSDCLDFPQMFHVPTKADDILIDWLVIVNYPYSKQVCWEGRGEGEGSVKVALMGHIRETIHLGMVLWVFWEPASTQWAKWLPSTRGHALKI